MESQEKKELRTWPWALLFLFVFAFWLFGGVSVYLQFSDWASRGQFGDMFGAMG